MSSAFLVLLRETGMPLLKEFKDVISLPHTISYVIRKSAQIASFNELPKDKRPPEYTWDNPEALEEWFDKVMEYRKDKDKSPDKLDIIIQDFEIEG